MFENVIGSWPSHEKFILTSCDEIYFQKYFPRFYKTYSRDWKLPIHVHIIDPSPKSLDKLNSLDVSYTYCTTDKSVLRFQYSYETYCQAQRFILLGHKLMDNQSVIVADVDSYSLREPNTHQKNLVSNNMAFTKYNDRLMATFCNFHYSMKALAKQAALMMQEMIENTSQVGVDQFVIKKLFAKKRYNDLKHGEWIRHRDLRTDRDLAQHNKCLIYHEKGTRGKGKGIKVQWTDIK